MKAPRTGTRAAVVTSRPRSFRLSSVRVDLKKLFGKLGEAAAHAALVGAGRPESIAKLVAAALGSLEAFSIDTPIEERAWRLVHGALARALAVITEELINAGRLPAEELQQFYDSAEIEIDVDNLTISKDFFKNPGGLPILRLVAIVLFVLVTDIWAFGDRG